MCDAYLCDMIRRIRAYLRYQKILAIQIKEWEEFVKNVRMELFQNRNNERSTGNDKGYNAYPESN